MIFRAGTGPCLLLCATEAGTFWGDFPDSLKLAHERSRQNRNAYLCSVKITVDFLSFEVDFSFFLELYCNKHNVRSISDCLGGRLWR